MSLQRVAAVLLVLCGTAVIVTGLFMPWFSLGIGDLGGSAGAMFDFSEAPEDSAWSSIGDIATLILIGAIGAVLGAVCVAAGLVGNRHPQLDRVAEFLLGGASILVGLALLLAWFEWEEFSSTLLFFPEEVMPGVFDAMYGNGPWVTMAGAIGLVAGLTLHLTRQKITAPAAAPAVGSAPSMS